MYSFFIVLLNWFSLGPVGDKKKQEDAGESEEDVEGSEED